MNEIEFVLQTVDVLNLNLFELETEAEVFSDMELTIMNQEELKFHERRLFLAIVGESHFFWIEGVMMELLACTELDNNLPRGVRLAKKVAGHNLDGLAYLKDFGPLRYTISMRFVKYDPSQINSVPQTGKEKVYLKEDFPFYIEGVDYPCWTQLRLAEDNNRLLLFTSHAYPPGQIVLTHSTFVF